MCIILLKLTLPRRSTKRHFTKFLLTMHLFIRKWLFIFYHIKVETMVIQYHYAHKITLPVIGFLA